MVYDFLVVVSVNLVVCTQCTSVFITNLMISPHASGVFRSAQQDSNSLMGSNVSYATGESNVVPSKVFHESKLGIAYLTS